MTSLRPDSRVLIIDDHVLFAEGLKAQLRHVSPNASIVIENDAARFLRQVDSMPETDLLIMDLNMPDIDGLDLIRRLQGQYPTLRILVVSANNNANIAMKSLELGACGYICKSSAVSVMLEGISDVLDGKRYIDPSLPPTMSEMSSPAQAVGIPPRTLQVLEYMAKGHSNKAIADILSITEATVKWHVSRLFDIFSVRNRTSCVNKAIQSGVVDGDQ